MRKPWEIQLTTKCYFFGHLCDRTAMMKHHVSWNPEVVMPVCYRCHGQINHGCLSEYLPLGQPPSEERKRRYAGNGRGVKVLRKMSVGKREEQKLEKIRLMEG